MRANVSGSQVVRVRMGWGRRCMRCASERVPSSSLAPVVKGFRVREQEVSVPREIPGEAREAVDVEGHVSPPLCLR